MKLRCWPGCLARINESAVGDLANFVGLIIRVGRYYGTSRSGKPSWFVHSRELFNRVPGYDTMSIPDVHLTPITPPPGSEEIQAQQGREVTA